MRTRATIGVLVALVVTACQPAGSGDGAQTLPDARTPEHENAIIDLWANDLPAFGVYVPDERPADERRAETRGGRRPPPIYTREGGEALARNVLYDFVFLNLEGSYDVAAVEEIAQGLRSPAAMGRKTLLVRIPPIERDGADVTAARVKEVLGLGADGVILPHVRSADEAKMAVDFFEDAGADVWSPSNPTGEIIAMIMIEDPVALASVTEIADTPGYSILACGIGSLTRALDGDREVAEAGNLEVLAHAKRVGVADMITANAETIEQRVAEGFLALLMQGPTADDVIRTGRAAAGRTK